MFDCTDSAPTTRRVREGTSRTGTHGDHGKESLMTGKIYQDEFHIRSWPHIPHPQHTAGRRIPSSKRRCVLTPHKDLSGGNGGCGRRWEPGGCEGRAGCGPDWEVLSPQHKAGALRQLNPPAKLRFHINNSHQPQEF